MPRRPSGVSSRRMQAWGDHGNEISSGSRGRAVLTRDSWQSVAGNYLTDHNQQTPVGLPLRRTPDPPKNLGHDFPLVLAIQNNRIILSALRLQHVRMGRSAAGGTPSNPMSLCHAITTLPLSFGGVCLRRVHGEDIAVVDQWHH